MPRTERFLLAALLWLSMASVARANFHIMRISEVLGQWHGDPRIQFVELTMATSGQNFLAGHKIIFQDAAGVKTGEVPFTSKVDKDANGSTVLIGTAAFQAAFNVTPDLLMPEGIMAPFSGRVCFDTIDCVAYGSYAGNTGGQGTPAPGFPVDGAKSLTIKAVTPPGAGRDNSVDYLLRDPTPKNNAGVNGVIPVHACFLNDPLLDPSKWDEPTGGAGIDLTSCGQPAVIDVGTVEASGGVLSLTPGSFDFPGIGPLGLTGIKTSVAKPFADENYRLRFVMKANPGIAVGAAFVRQHYSFDEAAGIFDIGNGFGFGMNFSFDDLNDEPSDHAHGDLRTNCFQDPKFDNEDNAPFDTFKMTSDTSYAVVMDIDGDDLTGPLTLQVKLYPAEQEEPIDYLATFHLADVAARTTGVDHSDPDLDHAVLLAAIGSSEASLDFSNVSICPIPRNQQHVRSLSCVRQEDGTILVTWNNPSGAEDTPIRISANGDEPSTVGGTETSFTIESPPEGALTISVTNYSGIAATCAICENNPPVVAIDAPASVELQDGMATFALDSTASTDGDNGTQVLSRFWELISTPPGGNASLDDPSAEIVNINVQADGDYKIRLTLADNGCQGDTGQSTVEDITVTVGTLPPPGGLQKPGDENQDGRLDLSDAVSILNHLFLGTNPSLPCGDGTVADTANIALLDANGDSRIDLSDAVNVLNFLFLGGSKPVACATADCACIRISGCPDVCQ